ncbi:hypothetical protein [Salicola sp. Rm-C-2C1-2]|uniref:hypothetical protein n=1 Tax=Salicola sp. Rm-C-2C1-2 TaxID=3141321 RepID=UPI0032E42FBC
MGTASVEIHSEVTHACKAVQQVDFVPEEQLEIIATNVFLRVKKTNDGDGDTTLISGIRAALFDHVNSLGIRGLPMRQGISERLDGPVDLSDARRGAFD